MAINDIIFRPTWFLGIESLFEIISMIILLLVSLYSYKVYKLSNNKKYKYLAVSFFSIGIGFLFKILSDSIVLYYDRFTFIDNLFRLSYFYTGSLILFAFLALSGYVILACLAAKVKGRRKIMSLLGIAFLCAILVRQARSFTFFYFFEFVLLIVYIIPYMYDNYKHKKNKNAYLVFLAFVLLALSSLFFIAMSAYNLQQLYIGGHFISLLAYIMLLVNLTLVLKK